MTHLLEILIWLSNLAVLAGAALEYWDVKHDSTTEPGYTEFPNTFGTSLSGRWIEGKVPSKEKRIAALGWKILTIGLLFEVALTPCLIVSQSRDERRAADQASQQQERIERLQVQVQQLKR